MFLKPGREDFSLSRCRRAFPLFAMVWGCLLLLALATQLNFRHHLLAVEGLEAQRLLDSYLSLQRSPSPFFFGLRLQSDHLPEGLLFIRIIKDSDQILITGEQVENLGFQELLDLTAGKNKGWLPMKTAEESGQGDMVIHLITRELDQGLRIQAAKEASSGYRLYRTFCRNTIVAAFAGALLLWPLALYLAKLSLLPILSTRTRLDELLDRSKPTLLPQKGNGPELDKLYRGINKLVSQNRNLVQEMQNSLDNVAHDLRTPMTRLRSVAEYALQSSDDPERLREALADCLEESERVLAMLKMMMSVAEAESGTMLLEKQSCDLIETLEQAITLYEYVAQDKDITVELQAQGPLLLPMDRTRITQVWANLIDNAIKYSQDGGRLEIKVETTDSRVQISFTDKGMGISVGEQDKIWERLYRGDRSRSEKGLGLGLSYVRAVVTAHGGEVSLSSTLHQGSCFTVLLPLAENNHR